MDWPFFPETPDMKGLREMEACRYSVFFRVGKRYFLKSVFMEMADIKGFFEMCPPRQNVSQFGIIPCLYSVLFRVGKRYLLKSFPQF